MKKKIYKPKKDVFLLTSIYLLIGSLTLVAIYFATTYVPSQKTTVSQETVSAEPEKKWMSYTNDEFKFAMEVPRLLTKREVYDQNDYRYLLILGQNKLSTGKGLAIGVSDRTIDEEIEKTKSDYAKDSSAELVREEEVDVAQTKATKLSYKPKDNDQSLELRDVIIISNGIYTYTISTDPEQMNHIMQTFDFL